MIKKRWTVCRIGDQWHALDRDLESRFSSTNWYAAMTYARMSAQAELQHAWNEMGMQQSMNRLTKMLRQMRDKDE